jgi:prepilin-type processing-associated H-X9-DG protein
LSLLLLCFAGVPAVLLAWLGLRDIGRSEGRLKGKGLAMTGLITGVLGTLATCIAIPAAVLIPAISLARTAAARQQSQLNLRMIGVALHNYDDAKARWPAAGFGRSPDAPYGSKGPRNLSWRVELLSHLDEFSLYNEFHHDEPWDSPHNKQLIAKMPKIYEHPYHDLEAGKTLYLGVAGPRTVFPPDGTTMSMDYIGRRDGSSNTACVVEVDPERAVIWTQPEDWEFDPQQPNRGLGKAFPGGFNALFADGHVAFVSADALADVLRAIFTVDDGEPYTY